MNQRPSTTYRASRRNLAKAHKLVWRALEREVNSQGPTRVLLPRWAWEMPKMSRGLSAGLMEDVNAPGYQTRVVNLPQPDQGHGTGDRG